LTSSTQWLPFLHASGGQSFSFVAQVTPLKPSAHSQENPLTRSLHWPPFWQGLGLQSSMLFWQV